MITKIKEGYLTVTMQNGKQTVKKVKGGLGKSQKNCLGFCMEYPGWHSFKQDMDTVRIVRSLAKRGLLRIHPQHTDMMKGV